MATLSLSPTVVVRPFGSRAQRSSARIAMSHHHNLSQEGERGSREGRFGLPHIGDKWAHKRERVFLPRTSIRLTHYATGKSKGRRAG